MVPNPQADFSLYAQRREHVLDRLGDDAILILPAGPELHVGRDAEVPYQPDSELYYLTGYTEPEAIAVLGPRCADAPFTLFVRARDPEREVWTGVRGGIEAACDLFGADVAFPIGEFGERLSRLAVNASRIYVRTDAGRRDIDDIVLKLLKSALARRQRAGVAPLTLSDPALLLDDMRVVKDATEITLLRDAASLTAASFREAAKSIRPNAGEWQVEAALNYAFRRRGASGSSFPAIVAGGANATILHYTTNERELADNTLVLVDAGARRRMYCADVSRTFPVNGKFTDVQRDLYDVVLAAHAAAIAVVRPGATLQDVHRSALAALVHGMLELGLLEGDAEALIEAETSIKPFYPHKTSHWLGLDVHDVGDYMKDAQPRRLEAGMVFTIEPGLYVAQDTVDVPGYLRGIGIRIEDDVLVTEDGCEVLTLELPTDARAVEEMMR